MTTRPIVFEVSVDGYEQSGRAFDELARRQRGVGTAVNETNRNLRDNRDRTRDAGLQAAQFAQGLGTIGQGLQRVGAELRTSQPQLSQYVTTLGQLGSQAAQNISAFGALGGAIVTAFETATPVILNTIQQLADVRGFAAEINAAFGTNVFAGAAGSSFESRGRMTREQQQQALARTHSQDHARMMAFFREQEQATSRINAQAEAEYRHRLAEGARAEEEFQQRIDEFYERRRQGEESVLQAREQAQQVRNEIFQQEQANELALLELRRARGDEEAALEQERTESFKAAIRQQEEAYRGFVDEIAGTTGPVTSAFVGAMSRVIAGAESADKAFQGLLASFLEMISQQSALRAAQEFAESIAAFARYDFGGGAQHLAAGAAFTAVAIATGAGAIAVAPPSGAPASPQQNTQAESKGGDTYVVNWNAGIITAVDEREMGRAITRVTRSSDRRASATV